LRYNLEFAASLLGPQAKLLVDDLRKLQEHLGELNDAAVTKTMLSAAFADGVDDGLDAYKRAQDKVIRRMKSSIVPDLMHFISKSNRRRLALAIAWI
jgi:CHAD domain-containing protein